MTFTELGLNARMVSRLEALGLTTPTPIQQQAIPVALQGRDVLGIAQTGTGKTAAFGIPLVVALSKAPERPQPRSARGLILAPTRELAGQIVRTLEGLTADLRITLVVGGKSIHGQSSALSRGTDILVATPGRLIDLIDRGSVTLGQTRFLVLDEADQMLDIGFIHALRRIAPLLGKDRQTMMFSATMPKSMADLSRSYLTDPVRVEVSPPGKVADKVTHSVHFVAKEEKQDLLIGLLRGHREDRALVFSRTKHGAERLMKQLDRAGFAAASIHGNKSQGQRDRALQAFRSGSVTVLVATDVAARGIDIPGVGHVYNFDLPNVPENYVHRIGRTARAGTAGRAIAFCDADEVSELKAIEKVLGMPVEVAGGSPWQTRAQAPKPQKGRRPRRRTGGTSARLAA
ncbi:DEAD/DEAH box helicase [Pararhodobacter aggregans]|uniref:DEAD/DEAH box helicase n=1 Tax=Pararhodobacter aggregans TaxID=404875 RepID=A0A2T7UMU9_9RHOB|nr:DEAD/DEAH box helicase [Pararhodobacter aggregans]PTW99419.1 ATP-dependent RNA helicase RhlE [Pararhodobacter aggregans]PVE45959.1 DEAD/DEAH box helicase [Pararhodobacter aggregans]